jgi:hypothetical protein
MPGFRLAGRNDEEDTSWTARPHVVILDSRKAM